MNPAVHQNVGACVLRPTCLRHVTCGLVGGLRMLRCAGPFPDVGQERGERTSPHEPNHLPSPNHVTARSYLQPTKLTPRVTGSGGADVCPYPQRLELSAFHP